MTTRTAKPMETFQAVRILGTIDGKISSRSTWMRVGLNASVISSNSRETPLTASRMLCAKTGNDTANIKAKMRVSVPRNQRITISVQDNAGTPMTKLMTGIK